MPLSIDPNILASIVSVSLAAIIGYILTRATKRGDARAQAEAALHAMVPQIIKEQNVRIEAQDQRIKQLGDDIDKLRERERECQDELDLAKARIASLEYRISTGIGNIPVPDQNASVLIVDDSPDFAKTIERQLNGINLITFHVSSGEDALTALHNHSGFKLVIMDILLRGDLDGIATAHRIREEGFNIPIIAVTGHQGILDQARIDEAKFSAVLIKSQFRYPQLIRTVKEQLGI